MSSESSSEAYGYFSKESSLLDAIPQCTDTSKRFVLESELHKGEMTQAEPS